MLTPQIGKGRPGYQQWEPTTLEGILNSAHLVDGLFEGDSSPTDGWNDHQGSPRKLLMPIIGSVFNDGLARVGIEDAFDRKGPPAAWKASDPRTAQSGSITLPSKEPMRIPSHSSNKPTEIRVDFSISGLSLRLTIVQDLAMAVLLLHILIATAHIVWILWRRESCGCWDSIVEFLVLAQNSRPAFHCPWKHGSWH